jgi:Fic family protein
MTFDRDKAHNDLPFLPPRQELETNAVMRQAIKASRSLAELKSRGTMLPNQTVLIRTLALLEAKDSSEIENIFTTHEKLYQGDMLDESQIDPQTKEVRLYNDALWYGVESIKTRPLSTNTFVEIFQKIKRTNAGIRKTSGTKISNGGEVLYTPPEGEDLLRRLLGNLENYLHEDNGIDPLIKMAVTHYQFEAIHPFTDGNGRTGRIINILYLLEQGLLETPVLFLSSHIIANKTPYYKGLMAVTEEGAWEEWVLYMLEAVEKTAVKTTNKISMIERTIHNFTQRVKNETDIYTKDLIEVLFTHPSCRIQFLADRLGISRRTASSYLTKLESINLLTSLKFGRDVVYFNSSFIADLSKNI